MSAEMAMHSYSDLMQVMDALGAIRSFPQALNGGKEHGGQHRHNANDHQQFQKGETTSPPIRKGMARLHDRTPLRVLSFGQKGC
jgi:hypothetical protein